MYADCFLIHFHHNRVLICAPPTHTHFYNKILTGSKHPVKGRVAASYGLRKLPPKRVTRPQETSSHMVRPRRKHLGLHRSKVESQLCHWPARRIQTRYLTYSSCPSDICVRIMMANASLWVTVKLQEACQVTSLTRHCVMVEILPFPLISYSGRWGGLL